ncbi:MAG: Fe-S protein assembly co-chaperone HscB [Magnetococcales bacterium]|nr:Fe-S protein assembly co-chaperone HscB [Magnetococcales bacterium]
MSSIKACWSCRSNKGEHPFCQVCGILQPPDVQQTFFAVLGVPAGFEVDRNKLEEGYRQAQQAFHPDRFVNRSATEKRFSAEHVTRINEAYQTLRDAMLRGSYILSLLGDEIASNQAPQDAAFLMEVMEAREELESITPTSKDAGKRIERMRSQVNAQQHRETTALAQCLSPFPAPIDASQRKKAKDLIHRLRYHRRFLEELENLEERVLG